MWRVYQHLFGSPADEAHEFRLEIFNFASNHFFGYGDQMRRAMLATYRAGMTPDEIRASCEREEQVVNATGELYGRRLEPLFSPDYNPATNPRPAELDEVLTTYAVARK
jgi:hypothetical protein